MIRLIFLAFALMALTACSSPATARLPALVEQAQTADKEARRALRNGDLARAQRSFSRLLTLQQSLDDTEGAAITLINLATVSHQLHDEIGALAWLDKVLLEKTTIYPAAAKTSAYFRRAVILVNLQRLSEAVESMQEAQKGCAEKCPEQLGISVLHARILLLQGDAQTALTLAQQVLKNASVDTEENTNAMRVLAEAEERLLRYPDSLAHYQQALAADKQLGLSARMAEDLHGLARVAKKLGQDVDAENYARRAALVEAVSKRER
jgi:tetratricopeptide (TPR) repeat protein